MGRPQLALPHPLTGVTYTMGTRNLIVIRHEGELKVGKYCQYDGFIEGQGKLLFGFLRDPENTTRLIEGLSHIK